MSVGDISRRQANTREISDIFHFTAIHFLPERHSAMVLIYIRTPTRLHYPARLRARVTTTSSDRIIPLNDIELVLTIWLVKGFTELAHEPLNEVGSGCGYIWLRKGIGTVRHQSINYSLVWRYLENKFITHARMHTHRVGSKRVLPVYNYPVSI